MRDVFSFAEGMKLNGALLSYVLPQYLGSVRVNDLDGSVLVEIPAGDFEMGDGADPDNAKHSVQLDSYRIGVFTVTNRQYQKFIKETGQRCPDGAEWGYPVWRDGEFAEALADHPVVCVSWDDAQNYCAWAGLSLPTEAQWEKAARGPQGFRYPWGNDWVLSNCLSYGRKGWETTCPVYSYPEGVSGYGLFNCAGNVLEWCADWYDQEYCLSPKRNPSGPDAGVYRVIRGGGWGSFASDCRSTCRSDFNYPAERANFRGFRVCSKT